MHQPLYVATVASRQLSTEQFPLLAAPIGAFALAIRGFAVPEVRLLSLL